MASIAGKRDRAERDAGVVSEPIGRLGVTITFGDAAENHVGVSKDVLHLMYKPPRSFVAPDAAPW